MLSKNLFLVHTLSKNLIPFFFKDGTGISIVCSILLLKKKTIWDLEKMNSRPNPICIGHLSNQSRIKINATKLSNHVWVIKKNNNIDSNIKTINRQTSKSSGTRRKSVHTVVTGTI